MFGRGRTAPTAVTACDSGGCAATPVPRCDSRAPTTGRPSVSVPVGVVRIAGVCGGTPSPRCGRRAGHGGGRAPPARPRQGSVACRAGAVGRRRRPSTAPQPGGRGRSRAADRFRLGATHTMGGSSRGTPAACGAGPPGLPGPGRVRRGVERISPTQPRATSGSEVRRSTAHCGGAAGDEHFGDAFGRTAVPQLRTSGGNAIGQHLLGRGDDP
jgi:hypothetical protein